MPTLTEVKELVNNCIFNYGTYNGVKGNYVTGPNGNSIFLPFAGSRGYVDLGYVGYPGTFWSGTCTNGDYAYNLCCGGDAGGWDYYDRFNGLSVRPVTEK
jgi:hypothetical protein